MPGRLNSSVTDISAIANCNLGNFARARWRSQLGAQFSTGSSCENGGDSSVDAN